MVSRVMFVWGVVGYATESLNCWCAGRGDLLNVALVMYGMQYLCVLCILFGGSITVEL